ncbi:zinc finger A20 and AN1 domain-containing stress-associated protein 1-like [Punica granatum]|uniref:Uncharacterized protein n=2 Tax=Punica granatum TaxID=22663 RepID=A0A218WIQ1_PUNGR|nr:zinc finger A20 and AN1 domain-containing stress-associated protein 1-like [Punica granatum]OWM71902.1 hypothetical protein CDL15_Pgr017785 [Punica granatum]PKI69536.1 hypothetical protein CRG98_010064 [Punica granatum]
MASEQNEGSTSVPFSDPKLCANNCGFWGNPTTMNLCSKCYKDCCLKEERDATAKAAVKSSFNSKPASSSFPKDKADISSSIIDCSAAKAAGAVEVAAPEGSGAEQPPPKGPTRCGGCNKKVGLTGFNCKCGKTFCGAHRYPESHNCTFDFKGAGRDAIAKANPVVKADKVERF